MAVQCSNTTSHTISDLRNCCLNIWYNLSLAICCGSVPREIAAVLLAKCGPTCYWEVVIMFWLLSILIHITYMFFNTFQQCWKVFMHSICLYICPSVHALTLVNILQMSWNWYMLFISDIAWNILKMVCIRLMICLQRHTKVYNLWGKMFKVHFNIFILH